MLGALENIEGSLGGRMGTGD